MKIIHNQQQILNNAKGCTLSIGNFDGMHRGHQCLIAKLQNKAKALDLPSVLMMFEPQPQEYFANDYPPARLTSFAEKMMFLNNLPTKPDYVLRLKFDQNLAGLTAFEFVSTILIQRLNIKYLLIGKDFRFGKQRQGDTTLLAELAQQYSFHLELAPTFVHQQRRISSSWLRQTLNDGDLTLAKDLLGRPYTLTGRVVKGQQRGRSIGVPTANLNLQRLILPLSGVFVVNVHGLCPKPLNGVANIGCRPTVDGSQNLLEVHLFDYDKDIYGKKITVEFCYKLRDEKRFNDIVELKQQIYGDIENAKNYYNANEVN